MLAAERSIGVIPVIAGATVWFFGWWALAQHREVRDRRRTRELVRARREAACPDFLEDCEYVEIDLEEMWRRPLLIDQDDPEMCPW